MNLRTVLSLVVIALITGAGSSVSAAPLRVAAPVEAQAKADPISGDWSGRFEIGHNSATLVFNLKLDGDKVTGSADSAHTGPGTISKGSWADNKLVFTLDFAAHESIIVNGILQDGKLSGEFRTEGMVGTWVAEKKAAAAAGNADKPGSAVGGAATNITANAIAGEWDATFEAQGTMVPVSLKFIVDGDKFSGSSESAHLGPGKISKGSWTADKLNFNMDGAFGSVSVSGVLRDGTLAGEFDMGKMHGTFTARKK